MALLPGDADIKHLYKFLPANGYTIVNLAQQQLHFSYPRELNDPFDCASRIIYPETKQDWEKWLDELSLSPKKRLGQERYLASIKYDGNKFSRERYQEDINSFIVLALSEINDHILLWSHYAQSHKGICLGFATRIEGESLGILFDEPTLIFILPNVEKGFLPVRKVKYTKMMPEPYNRLRDDDKKLMEFTITKHVDWKYESERRIVLPRSFVDTQLLKYNKISLEQVIFGYRSNDTFRQQIYDAIRKHYNGIPIQFYQAKPKDDEYSLIIERIPE